MTTCLTSPEPALLDTVEDTPQAADTPGPRRRTVRFMAAMAMAVLMAVGVGVAVGDSPASAYVTAPGASANTYLVCLTSNFNFNGIPIPAVTHAALQTNSIGFHSMRLYVMSPNGAGGWTGWMAPSSNYTVNAGTSVYAEYARLNGSRWDIRGEWARAVNNGRITGYAC